MTPDPKRFERLENPLKKSGAARLGVGTGQTRRIGQISLGGSYFRWGKPPHIHLSLFLNFAALILRD